MTTKDRIRTLIKAVGGRSVLARRLGVSYTTVNNWYNNGVISMSCVKSLHSALPWVSMNWLIFGEGEMDIYNKEHSDLKKSFDNLMALNDELRKQLDKKIKELKHYELRTNTCKV